MTSRIHASRSLVTLPRLAVAGVALLSACASAPPPQEQLAVGRAAVARAEGPAATDAPLEMAAARDKIARANTALVNKDHVSARQLAEQAEADATLAEAQARSTRSEKALTQVREGIRQLREQAARQ